jgi:hypothetical protein
MSFLKEQQNVVDFSLQSSWPRHSCPGKEVFQMLHPLMSPHSVIEWGAPRDQFARSILASTLAYFKGPILWIHSHRNLTIFPPAWQSKGLDLNRLFFIQYSQTIKNIGPCFQTQLFNFIILDCPLKLTRSDLRQLQLWAKSYKYCLFILRPFLLSSNRGNPYAHLRFNLFYQFEQNTMLLQPIKGKIKKNICFNQLQSLL